jgi:hypothetical protein
MDKLDELIKDSEELVQSLEKRGTKAFKILTELYGNPTHFITELLQNAEDEGAKQVEFILSENQLEFSHNAKKLFDFNDIRAISNFGDNEEKKEKPNAIGRFGIGFKSVYAITDTPRIMSDEYDITIHDYIIPRRTTNGNSTPYNGTKIILPFKTEIKKRIFELLTKELQDLNLDYLLFLSNIDTIKWKAGGNSGTYQRTARKSDKRFITLISENKEKKYFLIEKAVQIDKKNLLIKIAFQLDDKKNRIIIPTEKSLLFVFFPTKIETNLKFLVHAPFFTTPARENIQEENSLIKIEDDHRNEKLREELGKLLAESLSTFKELKLLNIELLQILPLNSENCKRSLIYNELYNAVKTELNSNKKLIPTNDDYTTAKDAIILGSAELAELLKPKQTIKLFNRKDWIDKNVTENKTNELWRYLKTELAIPEYDLAGFASKIDEIFMTEQTDKWIIQFYKIIHNKGNALWREGDKSKAGILRLKPIIRTESNGQIAPYKENKKPNVYLPVKENRKYTCVKKSIANDKEVKQFLKDLGLTEPDLFAEINELVIKRFNADKLYSGYFDDFKKILEAVLLPNKEKRNTLIEDLRTRNFILGVNYETGETKLLKYNEVYFLTEDLKKYFTGNSETFFVADEQYSLSKKSQITFKNFLKELGVSEHPHKIVLDEAHLTIEDKKKLRAKSDLPDKTWERVTDYDLDGLQFFSKNITIEKSLALWNILLSAPDNYFSGKYEWKNYASNVRNESFEAKFMLDLKTTRWLFDKNKNLISPLEITNSQLAEDYDTNNTLSSFLGFKPDEITAIEEKTGGKFLPKEELEEYEEFKKWKQEQSEESGETENSNEEFVPEFKPNDVTPSSRELEEIEVNIEFKQGQGNGSNVNGGNNNESNHNKTDEPAKKPSQKLLNGIGDWGQAVVDNELAREFADDTNIEIDDLNKKGKKGVGCDFVVKRSGQIIRLIEVKSTVEPFGQPLSISGTQWEIARNCFNENDGDKYWVYCVFNAGQKNSEIIKVKNPIKRWREGKLFAHPINFIIQ